MFFKKKVGLNSRGLLFTIMTFFLILGIISLNQALNDTARGFSPSSETIALYSVGGAYRNASSLMLDLDKNGYSSVSMGRIFPFSAVIERDLNVFSLEQIFSIDGRQIDAIFDYLNLTKIILQEQNYDYAFTGVVLDINAPRNSSWGGTNSSPSFLVLPFCYKYSLDSNIGTSFSAVPVEPPCKESFDVSKMGRVDFNVFFVSSLADFNSVVCAPAICVANSPPSNNFYNIIFDKSNCPSCLAGINSVSVPLGSDVSVEVKGTLSPALVISILNGTDINFSYASAQKVSINSKFYFNRRPEGFVVMDVNISAHSLSSEAAKNSG